MKSRGRRFHIVVEVAKVHDPQFRPRTYDVIAETRAGAERKALALAKEEWHDARLPEDRVF